MLKHTLQFQREQIKQEEERKKQEEERKKQEEERKKQEEINKICQKIPDFQEKIEKEKKLLSLMLAIKKLSEKEEKTPEEINSLNEMFAMYEKQQIILARFENTIENLSNKSIIDEPVAAPAILTPVQTSHVEEKSLFLQQLQKVALKKVEGNTNKNTLASPENNHSASSKFLLDLKNALSKNKLKQVNSVNTVVSEVSDEAKSNQSELQRKLAKQRALLEEGIINKESVTPVTDLLKSNDAHSESEEEDNFDFYEKICHATGIFSDELDTPTRFINTLSKIFEDKTRPNSTMDELDALLESLNEQVSSLDNEIKKPQAPLSMYFNSSPKDKPVIVEAVLKPMP